MKWLSPFDLLHWVSIAGVVIPDFINQETKVLGKALVLPMSSFAIFLFFTFFFQMKEHGSGLLVSLERKVLLIYTSFFVLGQVARKYRHLSSRVSFVSHMNS